jgi:hypothetical protein
MHRNALSSRSVFGGAMLALVTLGVPSLQAQPTPLIKEIRRELRSLPSYGVFDLLTFKANDDGSVTLGGYLLSEALKKDAETVVSSVKGVTKVDNRIEVAPVSVTDDELRRKVFRAIYRDPFLARYGTPADEAAASRARFAPWGDGFRDFNEFGTARWMQAPFFGQEPIGNYAIHILVKRGVVTLAGTVDNEADKTAAAQKARLAGAGTVNNDLHVTVKR